MSRKIVFLGGGNMAEGILRAMVSSGAFSPEDVTMQEILPARCEYLEKTYGVKAAADAGAAAASADMVIVAVVPSLVGAVAEPLKDIIGRETVVNAHHRRRYSGSFGRIFRCRKEDSAHDA